MELKPCPFCGGKAKLQGDLWPRFVYCTNCYGRTKNVTEYGFDEGAERACELWNERVNTGNAERVECKTDTDLMGNVIIEICDYAVRNGMEPNNTLRTIAENIEALLEISTFNNWKETE